MIALIQRVTEARVSVAGATVGEIEHGILALVGVRPNDSERSAEKLLDKMLAYRIFADHDGKMNLNVKQKAGGVLLVPQFTLAADTRKGLRPSFSSAAEPGQGEKLFDYLLFYARKSYSPVASGQFGADMQVQLTNDGPVTFMLDVE